MCTYQFVKRLTRRLDQQPVHHQARHQRPLAVRDDHHLLDPVLQQLLRHQHVRGQHVGRVEVEDALQQQAGQAEEDAVGAVADARDGPVEGHGEFVDGRFDLLLAMRRETFPVSIWNSRLATDSRLEGIGGE